MAALVCDICGGKLSMTSGGIAVCDSCGMEHTRERMQEKVQEIKGTVRVDNSHMIDNYLTMAENAYEADNKAEAETYCNKIIEIDPTHCKAWLLKGQAAGWQSTISNSRFNEAAICFAKAIDLAPEDEIEAIQEQSAVEMRELALALISQRGNRFAQFPDEEETDGFLNDIGIVLEAMITLAKKGGVITTGFMEEIANIINQSVVSAWINKILPDYNGTDNHPGELQFRQLIERIEYCTMLVEKAIELSENDDEHDIDRYTNLIFLHKRAIESCSWEQVYNYSRRIIEFKQEYGLTEESKSFRLQKIADCEKRIIEIEQKKYDKIAAEELEKERIEKEEANNRFIEYWNLHTEEKGALENEKESITGQISLLNDEISNIDGQDKKQNLQERIQILNSEKSSLGLLKLKEKKAIQEQIDVLSNELKIIESKMSATKAEIENRIKPLQKRFDAIQAELTIAR